MWTTSKALSVKIKPRPGRIAYLVPEAPPHVLIDVLFEECLARWGGRRTPIVPTDGQSISLTYWALLDLWDADIIYSYVSLSNELETRLFRLLAPSEIKQHQLRSEQDGPHDLRPDYTGNFSFLSSLSLLPIFSRRTQMEGQEIPLILDDVYHQAKARDLADSFGFVSRSCVDQSLLPHARRLSIRKPHKDIADSYREPAEITYLNDETALIEELSINWGLLFLTQLSDMFCPYLNQLARGNGRWNDHMTIIIGDEVEDRLLFWNTQHRYKSLDLQAGIPVLRISPDRLKDGVPAWLDDGISKRNHHHLNGNSAPRTILRSCSIQQPDLEAFVAPLTGKHMVMVSAEHVADPCLFDECRRHTSENRSGPYALFPSIWTTSQEARASTFRFKGKSFEVPLTPPWHLQFAPLSGLTMGIWGVDLTIERCENHSHSKPHVWMFPRRLRTEQAVTFENYQAGRNLILPPNLRPTESGDLSIWDGLTWTRPTLEMPSDLSAFARPILHFTYGSLDNQKAIEGNVYRGHYSRISFSDKGRDLLGVLQHFANLPEALSFLTDPFWIEVIRRLSPESPEESKQSNKQLANTLRQVTAQASSLADIDHDFVAKRALELAGRSFAARSQHLKSANFETLLDWAKTMYEMERSKISEQLSKSVEYLRDRGFLWQGHAWRCLFCEHHNWVALEQLKPISNCEICRKPQSSPVSRSLDFRLNPFVHHAFASTSGQESIIWCLNELANRAHSSFAWFPAIELYRHGETTPLTDLDIIATVDGNVYLVEVKHSFAGVSENVLAQIERSATELRPDVSVLAVMAGDTEGADHLKQLFDESRDRLSKKDVRFELLTKNQSAKKDKGDYPLDTGTRISYVPN